MPTRGILSSAVSLSHGAHTRALFQSFAFVTAHFISVNFAEIFAGSSLSALRTPDSGDTRYMTIFLSLLVKRKNYNRPRFFL